MLEKKRKNIKDRAKRFLSMIKFCENKQKTSGQFYESKLKIYPNGKKIC